MTVRDLILYLQGMPDNMTVVFLYPSHDHWDTTLAREVTLADTDKVTRSDYHRCDKLLRSNDEDRPDAEEIAKARTVVTLS